jgi:hypothetical protein
MTADTPKASFEEVLAAMGEVDRLRNEEEILGREAAGPERKQDVARRLREAYAAQGTQVDDATIQAGVEAYFDRRLRFVPGRDGLARFLALAWVHRGAVAAAVAAVLIFIAAGVAARHELVVAQRNAATARAEEAINLAKQKADEVRQTARRLAEFETLSVEVRGVAKDPAADGRIAEITDAGREAASNGDSAGLERSDRKLRALLAELRSTFEVRIVDRPGQYTRLWYYANGNRQRRLYYVVVEAVDPEGRPVVREIVGDDDHSTRRVSVWAERVDQALYDRIGAEKSAGAIADPVFARKRSGWLSLDYREGPKADGKADAASGRINHWQYGG